MRFAPRAIPVARAVPTSALPRKRSCKGEVDAKRAQSEGGGCLSRPDRHAACGKVLPPAAIAAATPAAAGQFMARPAPCIFLGCAVLEPRLQGPVRRVCIRRGTPLASYKA